MKKMLMLIALIIMVLTVTGCKKHNQSLFGEARNFYETPHQLRELSIRSEKSFFTFLGSPVATHVRFLWEIKDDIYIVTTLPLAKVRTKLAEETEIPTASFFLDEFAAAEELNRIMGDYNYHDREEVGKKRLAKIFKDYMNPHRVLKNYLSGVVFTVKNSDWLIDAKSTTQQ